MTTQRGSVISILGGRGGWRFWWPAVPWLGTAVATWPVVTAPGAWGVDTQASGRLFVSSVIATVVLWLWGARPAVQQGHDRRVVYAATCVLSIIELVGWFAVAVAANLAEIVVRGGVRGPRVFALGTNKREAGLFGENATFFNSLWLLGAVYVLPVFLVLIAVCCGAVALTTRGAGRPSPDQARPGQSSRDRRGLTASG